MAGEDEFIVPDLPEEDVVEEYEVKPEDGIEVLKAQLEEARREAAEAKKAAYAKSQEAYLSSKVAADANHRAMENDLHLIEGAIAEIERNEQILQQGLIQANAAGDFARVAEIQREILSNSSKMQQLSAGRAAIADKLAAPRPEPEAPVVDPVDYVTSQLPARSADWVRAHPEFVRDKIKWQKLQAADQLARADGLKVESDEYFQYVENILGITGGRQVEQRGKVDDVADDPMSMAATATKTRESPRVAPVSEAGANSRNAVTLTREEREIADNLGMSYKDYAVNKAALLKEGRITRH